MTEEEKQSQVRDIERLFLKPLSLTADVCILPALFFKHWILAALLLMVGLVIGHYGASFHPLRSSRELAKGTNRWEPEISQTDAFVYAQKSIFWLATACLISFWHYSKWYWGILGFIASAATLFCSLMILLIVRKRGNWNGKHEES